MTTIKKAILASSMGTAVIVGAVSGALAQPYYYEPDDNGTVWSYYPGYTSRQGPLASPLRERDDFAAVAGSTQRQSRPAPVERHPRATRD